MYGGCVLSDHGLLFIHVKRIPAAQRSAILVPPVTKGFLILVPRGSFSFVHVVGDFKSSSTRAESFFFKIADDCSRQIYPPYGYRKGEKGKSIKIGSYRLNSLVYLYLVKHIPTNENECRCCCSLQKPSRYQRQFHGY